MNAPVKFDLPKEEQPTAGAVMPRHTVEALVAKRNVALQKFGEAWEELNRAHDAQKVAYAAWASACSAQQDRYSVSTRSEKQAFVKTIEMCPRADYLKTARRLVDVDVWRHVIELTDLERLMDKTAKDQFHKELLEDPPEATVDNICATLERFALDAGDIFKRGIATAFSKFDRRFKSHDGFKVGSRIILDRMFSEHGSWNYHRDMESVLLDVERTFLLLDEKRVPASYAGIVGQLRNAKSYKAEQLEIENDYFLVRVFQNGNCHVWMKRKDLTKKVNKLLHEWYGETIGDGMKAEADPLKNMKLTPAKRFGFYPTPEGAADRLMDGVPLWRSKDKPRLRVLEPSAGTGNLASRCVVRPSDKVGLDKWSVQRLRDVEKDRRFDNQVDCVEVQPAMADALRAEGIYGKVICGDFLAIPKPQKPEELYDVVVMNPPFDLERDIDHVVHALEFLAPDGYLTAIMSAGTEWRETPKSVAFRKLISKIGGKFRELPEGSFSSVGTNVNTTILRVRKDGSRIW